MVEHSRALVVGINEYDNVPNLNACVDDANRMAHLLKCDGNKSPNYSVKLLTSDEYRIDRAALREQLADLFATPAQRVLFFFSGHGQLASGGGCLVTQDSEANDRGILTDELLAMANASPALDKTILLDCCHAGAAGVPGVAPSQGASLLAQNVTILAASRKEEKAFESRGGGVFSSLCVDALEGGAANLRGEITSASLYGYIEEALGAWQQRPIMRSNVSHLCTIRRVDPPIPAAVLRRLPTIFSEVEAELQLSPAFDPALEPHDPIAEEKMSDLRALLRVGLLETIDGQHLFDVARLSLTCQLTPTGRQQWRLATEGYV